MADISKINRYNYLRLYFLPSCFLICFCSFSIAQEKFIVEHLGPEDGLSHRWVTQVIQGRDGFLWVSTADGLNRYDGHAFKTYPELDEEHGIQHIYTIQEAQNGMIWMRTIQGEKVKFDPHTRTAHIAEEGTDDFIPPASKRITIHQPFAGYLPKVRSNFNNSKEKTDSLFSPSDTPQPRFPGLKSQGNECMITVQKDRALWVWYNLRAINKNLEGHTVQHYARLDLKQKKWERYRIGSFLNVEVANSELPIDIKGRFWFPSYHNEAEQPFDYFQLPVDIPAQEWQGFRVDNRQNIWVYDQQFRLYRFDIEKRQLEFIIKMNDDRLEVYEDQEGTLWIGSQNGLLKLRRRKQLFEKYMDQPFDVEDTPPIGQSVYHATEIGNGQIITRSNAQWYRLDPKTRTVDSINFRTNPDLVYHTSDHVYLAEPNPSFLKFHIFEHEVQEIEVPDDPPVFSGSVSNKLPLIFSAEDGDRFLYLYDTLSKTFEKSTQPLQGTSTNYPFWDQERQLLWSNYGYGLRKINLRDLSETHFQLTEQNTDDYIRAWIPEGDSIWLATLNGLILMDTNTGAILRQFTTEDGLPHNTIYSAIEHKDWLWLGTGNGLCRFHRRTFATRNFFVADGLSHYEFNSTAAIKSRNGKIWMGGLNGFNVFDPEALAQVVKKPMDLSLASFSKYHQKKDSSIINENRRSLANATCIVYPQESSLTFRFFLNSLIQPEKHQYSWFLEGYESQWAHASQEPVATYQYLPPGHYTLRVKALDATGNPARNELAIPIQVVEVWYKRWWAWGLYCLMIGGLVFTFYRFQINRKLAQQEAIRLKELDAVKSKLYTNITHEFRTPLTVILGMTKQLTERSTLLATGNEAKQELEWKLDSVQRNGQHLLNLINQMLDLSKLEAGKLSLQLIQANIITYLKYIVSSFQSFAAYQEVDLQFQSEVKNLQMDFDKDKMLTVVSNLLSNAIKFTPAGGNVTLRTNTRRVLKTRRVLVLNVEDTGIGIPPSQLPNIFDRFYQVDDSATRKGEGTGIGLTLVQELVKLMQGEIKVESEEGRGSTFTVLLPVTNEAPLFEPGLSQMTDHTTSAASPPVKESVQNKELPLLLVVEDNADVAHYIQSCLEHNYQILIAPDGQKGIDKAIEAIPDIIISDVMMPNKDGFELVQTLKNDERTSHIPIILLTAKADIASRIEGLDHGADAYLPKPFNREELQVRLEKLIELRRKLRERYSGHRVPQKDQPLSKEDAFLEKVKTAISEAINNNNFGSGQLAKQIHLSESQLYRKLKALTGQSTAIYIRSIRLQKARELLETTQMNVTEVAFEVGFTNLSYFSRVFSQEFGIPPNEARN